ncbi:MAG TPA: helix-turn-helix domain-containing protein, partial [Rhodopseudomonas sp.]|uniref:helix-turn-helix transcriptional regulator n=1 Tax=Rhodopseudomonas sp. TaxID=1078 RepID=UPI002EDB2D0B
SVRNTVKSPEQTKSPSKMPAINPSGLMALAASGPRSTLMLRPVTTPIAARHAGGYQRQFHRPQVVRGAILRFGVWIVGNGIGGYPRAGQHSNHLARGETVKVTPDISTAIKSARKKHRLSQAALGALIGTSQNSIYEIESGETKFSRHLPAALAALQILPKVPAIDCRATADLLAFLHYVRAEHGIDVPERHFEMLRTLHGTSPSKAEAPKQ